MCARVRRTTRRRSDWDGGRGVDFKHTFSILALTIKRFQCVLIACLKEQYALERTNHTPQSPLLYLYTPLLQTLPINLAEPPPIPLNIRPHLRQLLIELLIHSPILQVAVVPLKQRAGQMQARVFVEVKRVFKGKGPCEAHVA